MGFNYFVRLNHSNKQRLLAVQLFLKQQLNKIYFKENTFNFKSWMIHIEIWMKSLSYQRNYCKIISIAYLNPYCEYANLFISKLKYKFTWLFCCSFDNEQSKIILVSKNVNMDSQLSSHITGWVLILACCTVHQIQLILLHYVDVCVKTVVLEKKPLKPFLRREDLNEILQCVSRGGLFCFLNIIRICRSNRLR